MFICRQKCHSTSRRARDKPQLQQKRFYYVLYRNALFVYRRSQCIQSHGTAIEFVNDSVQNFAVSIIESEIVNLEMRKCMFGDRLVNFIGPHHQRKIAHSL